MDVVVATSVVVVVATAEAGGALDVVVGAGVAGIDVAGAIVDGARSAGVVLDVLLDEVDADAIAFALLPSALHCPVAPAPTVL